MPRLTHPETIDRLGKKIRDEKIDVMIFDPICLGLLRDNPNANTGDVLQMGPMLQKVVDI